MIQKRNVHLVLLLILVLSSVNAHVSGSDLFDRIDLDWENSDLVISEQKYDSEEVIITRDKKLYIDNRMIEIDSKNQELLEQYYYHAVDMRRLAKAIGVEAAQIGVAASGVAIKAVVNAFSGLFDDDYDDCTEEELEISEEKLEKYSAKIEVLGRALELTVDDIEHIHRTLRRTVPELRDLDWF